MQLYSETGDFRLYQGSMLDMLQVIAPNSIDAVLTDPPYELGFMGKSWDNSGIAFQADTWRRCYQVLKHGGYLLAFGGTRTFHRIACAIEDAGFEIRDTIMWLYGSGFPKSMNIGLAIDKKNGVDSPIIGTGKSGAAETHTKTLHSVSEITGTGWFGGEYEIRQAQNEWEGWGTALKPAYEPVIVARKPCEGSCVDNVIRYGVGGLNIDGCRVPTTDTWQRKAQTTPCEEGYTIGRRSSMFRDKSEGEMNENGRYPANVILTYDESDFDEVCGGMPETKSAFSLPNHEKSKCDVTVNIINSGAYKSGLHFGDEGSAARYYYCAKASKRDRDEGLDQYIEIPFSKGEFTCAEVGAAVQLLKKVTSDLAAVSLSMYEYGGNIMVKFHKENRSIIKTAINKIIELKTLNLSNPCTTKEFTADANCEMVSGTNHVESVANSNELKQTITNENQALVRGANNVVLETLLRIKDEGNWKTAHNSHCTVKPVDLMQYLVRLVTPPHGTVLDPFNGSGSTGKAVMYENRDRNSGYKYIGIELTAEYLPIADARIRYAAGDHSPIEPAEQPLIGQITFFDILGGTE